MPDQQGSTVRKQDINLEPVNNWYWFGGSVGLLVGYVMRELPPEFSPESFARKYNSTIREARAGNTAWNPYRLPRFLDGVPKEEAQSWNEKLPKVAEAIFPSDFAKKVVESYKKLQD